MFESQQQAKHVKSKTMSAVVYLTRMIIKMQSNKC